MVMVLVCDRGRLFRLLLCLPLSMLCTVGECSPRSTASLMTSACTPHCMCAVLSMLRARGAGKTGYLAERAAQTVIHLHKNASQERTAGSGAFHLKLVLLCCVGCRIAYDSGPVEAAAIYATPVKPGVSKVFGRFKVRMPKGKEPPAFLKLLFGLPHWIMGPRAKLADQDTVMNVKQVSVGSVCRLAAM